jgi:hypothetical protein
MGAREVKAVLVRLLAVTATACTVGPMFKRPIVDLPPTFRGAPSDDAANATASAIRPGGMCSRTTDCAS